MCGCTSQSHTHAKPRLSARIRRQTTKMARLLSPVDNTAMADQQCELTSNRSSVTTGAAPPRSPGIVYRVVARLTSQIPVGPRQKARRSHARRPVGHQVNRVGLRWHVKVCVAQTAFVPLDFRPSEATDTTTSWPRSWRPRRRLVDLVPQRNLDLELFRNGLDGKPGTVQRLVEAPRGRRDAHFAGASVGHDPWQSVRHVLRRGGELFGTPVVDSYGPPGLL